MEKNKKNKNKGFGAVIVLMLAVLGSVAEGEGIFFLIPLLALFIIGGTLFVIGKKLRSMKPAATLPQKKEKEENCEFGELHHEFSHDDERRLRQLEGFYQDGLIGKEEYELLKKRWKD